MKSTGITRRIDDLGRVVIPKEIRRSLKIREGDAFEIYVDEISGMVCYQKLDVNNDICTELDRLLDKYNYDFDEVSKDYIIKCIEHIQVEQSIREKEEKDDKGE